MPRLHRLAVLTLALLAAAACHHARGIGYVRERLPPGQPVFDPGEPEGYWVWRDGRGWHLRTTSDVPHRFYGNVEAVGDALSGVQPIGRAAGRVAQDGESIRFDYTSSGGERGGEQGFDWVGSRCQRFELYIDGTTRPMRVFLGEVERSPARVPFAVCS